MNIVTIIDENWLDNHMLRFMNLALRAMPQTETAPLSKRVLTLNTYYLVVVYSKKEDLKAMKALPLMKFFEKVSYVLKEPDAPGYMQYNALRFSLLKRFKLDECLYMDADVDICKSLHEIAGESDAPLLWCKSPCEIKGFRGLLNLLGLNGEHTDENPHSNAGMLYIRKDYKKEYLAACERVAATDVDPRMIGNAAFNVMIRTMKPKQHAKAPYKYGVIWWDNKNLNTALSVHFCNDNGKAKRIMLESVWVS